MLKKQSLFQISKRDALPLPKALAIRGGILLLALIFCGLITTILTGQNPINVYGTILSGAFGTSRRIGVTARNVAVLLGLSLAVTPAFKMRFWNIGAEGQVLIGGVVSAACMIYLGGKMPNALLILLMIAGSALGGFIWGLIPTFFKAHWNTNETLFTLMMNYVAMQVVTFCICFWENPKGSNSVGIINQATQAGWLPSVAGNAYFWNVVIVMILTVAMFIYLKYSKQGYEIAVVGESDNTARYAGINVSKVMMRTMAISGAICGIAGFILVSGSGHTISTSTANGRGFTAIIVAWMAKFNTFVMILIAFGLVFMEKGATQIASQYGLNENASSIMLGIILFFLLGAEFFINYKIERNKK